MSLSGALLEATRHGHGLHHGNKVGPATAGQSATQTTHTGRAISGSAPAEVNRVSGGARGAFGGRATSYGYGPGRVGYARAYGYHGSTFGVLSTGLRTGPYDYSVGRSSGCYVEPHSGETICPI